MRLILLSMVVGCCVWTGVAEMREWTLPDGRTCEAEMSDAVSFDNSVKLIDATGQEIKVPYEQLSPADQEYVNIRRVPKLDIDFLKSFKQIVFESKMAPSPNEVRDPEIRASFGVRVKQAGTGTYDHELTAEFFAIGRQIYADRYLVLARESVTFKLTKENGRRFEYESRQVFPLRDFYLSGGGDRRGEKYHGYIVLITDELGRLVAHEESSNWLIDGMENLKKLRVGNYLDQECNRRYPIRPDPIVQRTN